MILKQRLFTNMFFRNMLADFGNRSADSTTPGKFTPYFRFKSLLANYWQKQKKSLFGDFTSD